MLLPSLDYPLLSTLNTDRLTRILEQCHQKSLSDEKVINWITDEIRYLIHTELTNNPIANFNQNHQVSAAHDQIIK